MNRSLIPLLFSINKSYYHIDSACHYCTCCAFSEIILQLAIPVERCELADRKSLVELDFPIQCLTPIQCNVFIHWIDMYSQKKRKILITDSRVEYSQTKLTKHAIRTNRNGSFLRLRRSKCWCLQPTTESHLNWLHGIISTRGKRVASVQCHFLPRRSP
jgi:hypothetical protein